MRDKEIWKDIPGYEGYYKASTHGRIKTLERYVEAKSNSRRKISERILALRPQERVGFRATLCKNGESSKQSVAYFILLTFKGERPEGFDCSHLDGNNRNNYIDNLIYESRSDNLLRKRKHGTSNNTGVCGGIKKLSYNDIRFIKKAIRFGIKGIKLANHFNVSVSMISKIKNNHRHKEI
ncbi:MAG: hypothetical protein GY861_16435 [bacterium]|nr:hypothetical protein [bacterium]